MAESASDDDSCNNTTSPSNSNQSVEWLGNEELNISIKPTDFKINVREEGEFKQQKFEAVFPKDLALKETVAYEENIPQEQQELVKNYFKKLAEG